MRDINIGRLRGGLCVYWTGDTGKRVRVQLKARTRKEAEAEAVEVYRQHTFQARPKAPLVQELWDIYVADLGQKPTATTMQHTGKAVLPHFGHYRPENIDKPLCESYEAQRRADGVSQGTIWTELGHLRSTLRFAEKTQLITKAPTIWRPAKPERDMRILNAGEARALIEAAHDPHIRLALILLLGTAARVGALLELQWDRVDFERGAINLRTEGSATRKGRAIVPMNGSTRAALTNAAQFALSDYVIEYGGGPIKSIRKGFQNAASRAKLTGLRIHDLRHTAAVTMLSAGTPIEKVAQVLGHSNTAVTYRVYARYMPEHMSDAVEHLDFMNLNRAR